jgi:2-polyprenyl-3-methyl-5-hydroxy-6-metoxy-1,4-benzoquinol methylase
VSESGPERVAFVCPRDAGALEAEGEDFLRCATCRRRFGVVAGIPDLRLRYADEYVSWAQDIARARELAAHLETEDLAGLLRRHWRRSGRPEELADRFLAGDLATVERSAAYLDALGRERGRPLAAEDHVLELGCGTAGLSAVAARRAGDVVASDVSLRWLVLARKRLRDAGLSQVRLACFAAEEPPFAPASFDVVLASDVIEHVPDQRAFAAGAGRVLRPGGTLFLATPNRFSLGLEPHVRLWGVGWLPRPLARRYVERARGARYDHVRLLSSGGLRRLLTREGLRVVLVAPEIPPGTQALYSGLELALVRLYNSARRFASVRAALALVGPFFHVFATKGVTRP